MTDREHHTIDMTAAERERLQELAVQTRSRSTRGTNAYQWSWKALIRRIGNGEIGIYEINPYKLQAWLDEAADAVEAQQREQAEQEAQRRRIAEQAKPQRKTPPVKLVQSQMELEPA